MRSRNIKCIKCVHILSLKITNVGPKQRVLRDRPIILFWP